MGFINVFVLSCMKYKSAELYGKMTTHVSLWFESELSFIYKAWPTNVFSLQSGGVTI